jgi:membrane carboxypeptidase/penicillin-binding protein
LVQRRLAAAVWLGFDQERSLGENDSARHLPMWIYFMEEAAIGLNTAAGTTGVVRMWVSAHLVRRRGLEHRRIVRDVPRAICSKTGHDRLQ